MTDLQTTTTPTRVTVTDIDMPFGSMVAFMLKWAFATIPAALVLMFVAMVVMAIFAALGGIAAAL